VEIIFSKEAQEDILLWKKSGDKKGMNRITELLHAIEQSPFEGIGKPELLKHNLAGYWSRRINREHRLVYRVINDFKIEVIALRFHYDK